MPAIEAADRKGVEQQSQSPLARYRSEIGGEFTSVKDQIEGEQVDALEAVTDELTNATKAALGLSGAFGDIIGSLIKIGIQRKLIGPLADALFGKADGSSSGGLGSIVSSIAGALGGTPGRASGGHVQAGRLYKINESGPELFRPAQSGKIYPTGSLQPRNAGGNATIVQNISVDGRNSVTPAGFARQILGQANTFAQNAATQAGYAGAQGSKAVLQKQQTLGT